MRDHGAIIEPATRLSQLRRRWDALDAREQRTLAEIRLEKGRILVEARKAFPRSGPKAAGWGGMLAEWRIEERTARRYMELAGYVESVPDKVSEIVEPARVPTYAEAGIVKQPAPARSAEPALDDDSFDAVDRGEYEDDEDEDDEEAAAPAPVARPAHVWTDEEREAEQRHHITRIQPPKMEAREDRTRRLSLAWGEALACIRRIRDEASIHLTDATVSTDEFESVKKTIVSVARAALDELEAAGALDAPEPRRRQLSILDGGKP